ncbi:VOC family protein [Kineococcus indalonis]|uniref:VOC family protein n=1 Tax=Kineococcus indalonis TaxID=2696566 RepID=UPI0014121A8D|nr:VOC family protein [Kineococcus indalonis]NAZ88465.1 VOC family protein [Kineococcus indalonis]
MFLGLRTVIYPAPDLAAGRDWFSGVLGFGPYFDEPFYVGFDVAGYELALDPAGDPAAGAVTCWGVADADAALARLLGAGAAAREAVREVGGGIRVATVREPAGAVLGVIENPHFRLPPAPAGPGPGRRAGP